MTSETEIDIQGVNGDAESASRGIEHGRELMHLAEAIARRDEATLKVARQALLEAAGPEVLVDAVGVAANFQRMVRIADAIGIPYDDTKSSLGQKVREDLNLNTYASAQHTFDAS